MIVYRRTRALQALILSTSLSTGWPITSTCEKKKTNRKNVRALAKFTKSGEHEGGMLDEDGFDSIKRPSKGKPLLQSPPAKKLKYTEDASADRARGEPYQLSTVER
ncbi:hypothetical protein PI124_g16049 [Phytophthora idaei]|nr:hypothetical protein PI125_g14699 [Phytophthora idaei]KAG3142235.1 hypothetical protein PI126_g15133 [Phytophthora idaei]KAG3239007.1 hypothetical protein PI124_g16049 [Phytophthora idaei]